MEYGDVGVNSLIIQSIWMACVLQCMSTQLDMQAHKQCKCKFFLAFKFKIRPNPFNMFFEIEKCVKTGFRIYLED